MDIDEPASPALTRDDVIKVARLALLDLGDDDLDRFTGQLSAVLDRARELEAVDTDGVPPTAHPYPLVNVFRSDEPEDLAEVRGEVLASAPETEGGRFRVPPALGEEL